MRSNLDKRTSELKSFLWLPGKLLILQSFLDADLCSKICVRAHSAAASPARIVIDRKRRVETKIRKTRAVAASPHFVSLVRKRLLQLRPYLRKCFRLKLHHLEKIYFLRYRRGDYHKLHHDAFPDEEAKSRGTQRSVCIIIFLNERSAQGVKGNYAGGDLDLYVQRKSGKGITVLGETGLLVAFRASTLHEVQRVRSGERITIVAWFH